ncbi:MAG: hypothetical protein R3C14_38570 [Caldilineaceae bacterium]
MTDSYNLYFGDIHNHCAVGYGHGSIEDAYHNARLQLDFACVTCHAWWPDLPDEEARLAAVANYHRDGFAVTARQWPHVQEVVRANHEPGRFVSFLGHEWHNCAVGDHNVYYRDGVGEILRASDLAEMRQIMRGLRARGVATMLLPHHIGYHQGYRGINWHAYTPEFSPLVEIMSLHGAAESAEAPRPYLHTMGPRDWESTYQYGLAQGHIVGVKGSTDHHSAHPGSYGHGRLGVWAPALTRAALWEAFHTRRTYALTGDNIRLHFTLNEQPLGAVLPPTPERTVTVAVEGGSAIDYVELLHNNRVIARRSHHELLAATPATQEGPYKVHFEVGWGERGANVDWQVELRVRNGLLQAVEPRFRGHEIVAPQASEEEAYAFSAWQRVGSDRVRFTTRTWGNPTTTTASTQGLCLTLTGGAETTIEGVVNGQPLQTTLPRLLAGPQSGYLGGFLTPCYYFHRAIPQAEYQAHLHFTHHVQSSARDWYYVRVRQFNDQWAWSSPIWVEGRDSGQ